MCMYTCRCTCTLHMSHAHAHVHEHAHVMSTCMTCACACACMPCACVVLSYFKALRVCVCKALLYLCSTKHSVLPRRSTRPLHSRLAYSTLGDGLALAPCTPSASPVPNDNHSARMILSDDLKCTVPPVRVESSVIKKKPIPLTIKPYHTSFRFYYNLLYTGAY